MRYEHPSADRVELRRLIESAYAVTIRGLRFAPVGECSYDYLADSDRGPLFVKIHIGAEIDALECRLAVIAAMHGERGIIEVVAALPNRAGRFAISQSLGPLALFPRIDAAWLGTDLAVRSPAESAAAGDLIGRVHACPPDSRLDHTDSGTLPFASVLRRVVSGEGMPPPTTPTAARVRSMVVTQAADILETLDRLEWQAGRRDTATDVFTHGDPNGANILRDTAGRLYLIDWDDLALGPPERDLIHLDGAHPQVVWHAYRAAGAPGVCRAEWLAYYHYRWALGEIADWGSRVLQGGLDAAEEHRSWNELKQYLPLPHEGIAARVERAARMVEEKG